MCYRTRFSPSRNARSFADSSKSNTSMSSWKCFLDVVWQVYVAPLARIHFSAICWGVLPYYLPTAAHALSATDDRTLSGDQACTRTPRFLFSFSNSAFCFVL